MFKIAFIRKKQQKKLIEKYEGRKSMNIVEMLLKNEFENETTSELNIKRLSEMCGCDIILKVKNISYNRMAEIQQMKNDNAIHVILEADTEGVFKNKQLMEKYNAVTPVELVKKLLFPGEISKISGEILYLSGYGNDMIEIVKKK